MTGWMWLIVLFGVIVLGLALFYGQRQSDWFRRHPDAQARQDEAVRRHKRGD